MNDGWVCVADQCSKRWFVVVAADSGTQHYHNCAATQWTMKQFASGDISSQITDS